MITVPAHLSLGAAVKPIPKQRIAKNSTIQDESELLNKPAPAFELPGPDDKMYSMNNIKGKIVMLDFWFISCKPCVNEMPVLNNIKNNYDPKKVVFLAQSLDSKDAVSAFYKIVNSITRCFPAQRSYI